MKQKIPAFEAAIKILSYGDKSVNAMWQKLVDKGYSEEEIEATVEKFKQYRYLDDAALARRYAEKHKEKKSLSQMKWELMNKGVSEETVEEVLREIEVSDDWD